MVNVAIGQILDEPPKKWLMLWSVRFLIITSWQYRWNFYFCGFRNNSVLDRILLQWNPCINQKLLGPNYLFRIDRFKLGGLNYCKISEFGSEFCIWSTEDLSSKWKCSEMVEISVKTIISKYQYIQTNKYITCYKPTSI